MATPTDAWFVPMAVDNRKIYISNDMHVGMWVYTIGSGREGGYKIQEALFNVGLHENLITLAHLSYFPRNKCRTTKHKTIISRVFKMTAIKHIK